MGKAGSNSAVKTFEVDLELMIEAHKALLSGGEAKAAKEDEKEAIDKIKFLLHYRSDLFAQHSGKAVRQCREDPDMPRAYTLFFACSRETITEGKFSLFDGKL